MGNNPSLFEQTPQEHAELTARFMEKQRETAIWPPETQVPPGHVLVHFYVYRHKVRDGLRPDMETTLRLEESGELSLYAVRRRWGLETCTIIDPLELKLGFPADPNWLPSRVVKELVERQGCIKVIEPYASYETLVKRQLRHIVLACGFIFHSYYILVRSDVSKDYHTLRRFYIDWTRAGYLVIFLAVVFLIFAAMMDIDLGILRLFSGVVDTVAGSAWMGFAFWAGLCILFFVAPGEHVKAMGLEDVKLVILLSA
ncbi:hypothetical protein DFH07DRAFT_799107 [Mycena maculata]|uniref:Uncharacterized protein n=1 Tax=Mycena maculata TaxID=230809 RepID=A0AAD7K2X6_9AGAR|nr:hypothetical protein DFH07DRAFT_799107 [Mycena maculata]